jgi:hypothetical protein
MDWVNDVNGNGGVDGTIKSTSQGLLTGEVRIILSATSAAGAGVKTLSVDVKCPIIPLDCRPGPFTFKVQVFETGPLSAINPGNIVTPNQLTRYTITGSGLDVAQILPRLTTLKNASIVSKNFNTIVVSGINPSCGGVDIEFFASGGSDDMPYKKSPGLTLPVAGGICGTAFSTSPITGRATTGTPDLQPISGAPVFRHIAPRRKVRSELFCNGMFAQATTAIVRTITVGDLVWGVRNTGGADVTVPFHAQLFRGGVMVDDTLITRLNAGASIPFRFHRLQSQTEVARLGLVPNSSTQQIYNSTGGECVQTVGQTSAFDWQDPAWEIRIDPQGAVASEVNRANNIIAF